MFRRIRLYIPGDPRCLTGGGPGRIISLEGKARKEATAMCYSYREYQMEHEARRKREEEEGREGEGREGARAGKGLEGPKTARRRGSGLRFGALVSTRSQRGTGGTADEHTGAREYRPGAGG